MEQARWHRIQSRIHAVLVRLRRHSIPNIVWIRVALVSAFVLLNAVPVAKDFFDMVVLRTARAQEMVYQLRAALQIDSDVRVSAVTYNPLVFSVEPLDKRKDHFVLSMEINFLLKLDDTELHAALAHELGHVWIYKHFPYLQTERLANSIGLRVVPREHFEGLYQKLWTYEKAAGVPLDDLLGPKENDNSLNASRSALPLWVHAFHRTNGDREEYAGTYRQSLFQGEKP